MKIDKPNQPLMNTALNDSASRAAAKSNERPAPSVPTPESTSVSIGATSAQLRSMEANSASAAPVNAAKVAEIKRAISEGRFEINSGVVADRLIATARDMLSATRRG